jgi:hypothetical protein
MNFKINSINVSVNEKYLQTTAYDSDTVNYLKGDLNVTVFNFPFNNKQFVHIDQKFPIDYISKELQNELLLILKKIEKEINE